MIKIIIIGVVFLMLQLSLNWIVKKKEAREEAKKAIGANYINFPTDISLHIYRHE